MLDLLICIIKHALDKCQQHGITCYLIPAARWRPADVAHDFNGSQQRQTQVFDLVSTHSLLNPSPLTKVPALSSKPAQ